MATTQVRAKCMICGRTDKVDVPRSGIRAYNEGQLVQKAFPDLDADKREIVIAARTGAYMCVPCWGPDPDEEE